MSAEPHYRITHTIEWRDPINDPPELGDDEPQKVLAITNQGIETCLYDGDSFENVSSGLPPDIVYYWAPIADVREAFSEVPGGDNG